MKLLLALVGAALTASSIGCCAGRCGNSCGGGCGSACHIATSQHAPRIGQMQGQACPCGQGLFDGSGSCGGACGHRGGLLGSSGMMGGGDCGAGGCNTAGTGPGGVNMGNQFVNSAVSHALDCAPTDNNYNFQQGPPTGQVAYPYYTTRGPRDFLARKPASIGPY